MAKQIKVLSYDEAIKKFNQLAKKTEDVAVFIDRGWGHSGEEATYEIVTDGNGQNPHAKIEEETFKKLRENKILGGNVLQTFKARRYHPFLNGKKDESTLGDKLYRN